ncbi:hypothetical protein BGZ80_005015 [Entomortierella chlamydospora]|uniref:Uncharacterized protein n=1 Tax=Entomortierella chlamydospora TaxID=101097 RepID=A0A9P6N666_9FUNG|nr:hypothetical protein BGZ79_007497 [Entomortierella chlamydospora]KAG0024233.1 hypothetical protein BGZ80_005015 [Entomortierella chlamydospora]
MDVFSRKIAQAPKMDDISKCMYMVVHNGQWIGCDASETFSYKVEYLKDYGFGDRVVAGKNTTSKIDAKPNHANVTTSAASSKAQSTSSPTNKGGTKKSTTSTIAAGLTRRPTPLLVVDLVA